MNTRRKHCQHNVSKHLLKPILQRHPINSACPVFFYLQEYVLSLTLCSVTCFKIHRTLIRLCTPHIRGKMTSQWAILSIKHMQMSLRVQLFIIKNTCPSENGQLFWSVKYHIPISPLSSDINGSSWEPPLTHLRRTLPHFPLDPSSSSGAPSSRGKSTDNL